MSIYDFSTLSPSDFEMLSRDLLQSELGVHLESFRSGRDGGIDLRYSRPSHSALWIIQAKHYIRSGFAQLKATLRNSELPKLHKIKPSRYIVVTSVSLTPGMKDELQGILTPFIASQGDIYGQEDLNNLLTKYPETEKAHFKLWLPTTAVLERLLHNGVFTQSALELEEIKRHLSLFVPTEALTRGLKLLDEQGFCMVTGIPGIGKTTTARLMVAHHVHAGWQGVYLASHVRDAFGVFNSEIRQIFFYDDFLGLTSLHERLQKNEDKELCQLITTCRKNPSTKRLVLTTREYLYEQARRQHEVLSDRAEIETARSIVELGDYTKKIRAKILVNHLYFHGIDPDTCSQFVSTGDARKTLDHPNYNPRIVEAMCTQPGIKTLTSGEFGGRFLALLANPERIWEHAFRNQLSPTARSLLLVFALHGSSVRLEGLMHQFRLYMRATGDVQIGIEAVFGASLKELEGTFLRVGRGAQYEYLAYHNPSVKDFTDAELSRDSSFLQVALTAVSFDGVLIQTARRLLEIDACLVASRELLAACKRGDFDTRYLVRQRGASPSLDASVSRERSLVAWMEIIKNKGDSDVVFELLEVIEEFFTSEWCRHGVIEDVVELYFAYEVVATEFGYKSIFSMQSLREILLPGCESPDDFVSMEKLLSKGETYPDDLEQLQIAFLKIYGEWLQAQIEGCQYSDEISDAVNSLVNAAELLGVSQEDLDLSDAKRTYERLAEAEEAQADYYIEQRQDERAFEREEAREVDDILDSLRE